MIYNYRTMLHTDSDCLQNDTAAQYGRIGLREILGKNIAPPFNYYSIFPRIVINEFKSFLGLRFYMYIHWGTKNIKILFPRSHHTTIVRSFLYTLAALLHFGKNSNVE